MASFRTVGVFAPVPNAFTEITPNTLIGVFSHTFGVGPQNPIYIRPGHHAQQDYVNIVGSEWLLYTRSVLSYRIVVSNAEMGTWGGCSLVVQLADYELGGVFDFIDLMPFHLMSGAHLPSSNSGIELPGLVARLKITKGDTDPVAGTSVRGVITIRGL